MSAIFLDLVLRAVRRRLVELVSFMVMISYSEAKAKLGEEDLPASYR